MPLFCDEEASTFVHSRHAFSNELQLQSDASISTRFTNSVETIATSSKEF